MKGRKGGERREDFGSGEATQLPDHVIAERRCQNAAGGGGRRACTSGRGERTRKRRKEKKGQKKAGDKRSV